MPFYEILSENLRSDTPQQHVRLGLPLDGMQVGDGAILARCGAGGTVLGVCSGPGQGQATSTSVPAGVQVLDLASGDVVESWALPGGMRPVLPAAAVGGGKRLIMACDDGSVVGWSVSDRDISKGRTLKVKGGQITRIVVDPALDAAVLLNADNKPRVVSADLKAELCAASLGMPAGAEVIFAGLLPDQVAAGANKSFLLVVAARLREGGGLLVRARLRQSSGGISFEKAKSDKLGEGTGLLACALHGGSRVLSIVWEGGQWQRYRVPTLGESGALVLRATSSLSDLKLGGVGRGLVLVSAGPEYLVAVGEGGGGRGCSVYSLDVVYGSRQSDVELMDQEGGGEEVTQAAVEACVTPDRNWCVIAMEKCVVACSLDTAKVTLASVIRAGGRGGEQQPLALRPVDILACLEGLDAAPVEAGGDKEGMKQVSALPKVVEKEVKGGNEKEGKVLGQLEKISKPQAYVEAVEGLLRELEREGQEAQADAAMRAGHVGEESGGGAKKGQKRGGSRTIPSQYFVHCVVERCVGEEAKGQLEGALVALLKAGAVSVRAEPGLFAHALEAGNLFLVRAVLQHATDVPEADLVKALRLILVRASKASLDAFVTKLAAEAPDLPVLDHDSARRYLLDQVMVMPREHMLLVGELRRLTLRETVRLLKYCQSLLKMHGVAANANAKLLKPKGARVPTLTCVVEWTSAILDAHYTALAMAPDCRALLQELSGIVKGETVLMREMLSLDGLLSHIVHRKKLPVKPIREYSVETLYL